MSEMKTRNMENEIELDVEQFVTFLIGDETYGVEVLRVQEIIGMTTITNVPNSLSFMKGVINLRGSVVPVVDMRLKFEMAEKEYDNFTVIIIVEVHGRLIVPGYDQIIELITINISDQRSSNKSYIIWLRKRK